MKLSKWVQYNITIQTIQWGTTIQCYKTDNTIGYYNTILQNRHYNINNNLIETIVEYRQYNTNSNTIQTIEILPTIIQYKQSYNTTIRTVILCIPQMAQNVLQNFKMSKFSSNPPLPRVTPKSANFETFDPPPLN